MSDSWIKTYRKISDWEWYKDSHMVHLFIHLLIKANHKDEKWKGITIKRGQLVTSRRMICEQTGIPERSIRTCLNRLKSTHEMTIKSTHRNSIITICNYDIYQSKEDDIDQQIDQQIDQLPTHYRPSIKQEYKEYKENNIYIAEIDEIYKAYPSKCPIRKASSNKSNANKEQIKKLLKKGLTKEKLLSTIRRYVDDCVKNSVYMKNFKTFLNNLPDYDEEDNTPPEKKLPVNDAGFRNFRTIDGPQ